VKEDALIAIEAASQMAERSGLDMAVMPDLSIKPLTTVKGEEVLEIVRCPAVLKRDRRDPCMSVH
jgi:hypothetical protein